MPDLSRRVRRALIDAVVTATGGGALDSASLHGAARRAFESERFAELWVRTIEARLAAIERLDSFDDQTFERARSMVNVSAAAYGDQQLGRATSADERRERAFELSLSFQATPALSLLTVLGFLELARRQGQTIPNKSAPRPRERPGATARGGNLPMQHDTLARDDRHPAIAAHRTVSRGEREIADTGRPSESSRCAIGPRHRKVDPKAPQRQNVARGWLGEPAPTSQARAEALRHRRPHRKTDRRAGAGIVVAHGYGLRVRVENRHLIIEDGFGRQRRTRRFHRTDRLRRLVLIGRYGYVTLDALRWLHDTGAALVHVDASGELIAASVADGADLAGLRRAQALAADGPAGLEVARHVLSEKVSGQRPVLDELPVDVLSAAGGDPRATLDHFLDRAGPRNSSGTCSPPRRRRQPSTGRHGPRSRPAFRHARQPRCPSTGGHSGSARR